MIERRPFGRTGHMSSVTLFGAAIASSASSAMRCRCTGPPETGVPDASINVGLPRRCSVARAMTKPIYDSRVAARASRA